MVVGKGFLTTGKPRSRVRVGRFRTDGSVERNLGAFWDNPVLGIGFRAHEVLLGISSHNGYLAMLAEIGLIGFVAVIYIILIGVFLLWRKVRHTELTFSHSILFGLSCGYLFLAMFERFLINVGNPTSLLFLIATLMSAKVTSRQRISLVRHANVSIRQPGLKGLKYTSM